MCKTTRVAGNWLLISMYLCKKICTKLSGRLKQDNERNIQDKFAFGLPQLLYIVSIV